MSRVMAQKLREDSTLMMYQLSDPNFPFPGAQRLEIDSLFYAGCTNVRVNSTDCNRCYQASRLESRHGIDFGPLCSFCFLSACRRYY